MESRQGRSCTHLIPMHCLLPLEKLRSCASSSLFLFPFSSSQRSGMNEYEPGKMSAEVAVELADVLD